MPSDDETIRPQDLLGLDNSDAEDAAYGSDDENARTNIRPTKRRRVAPARDDDDESDAPSDGDDDDVADPRFAGKKDDARFAKTDLAAGASAEDDNDDNDDGADEKTITNPSKLKPLTQKELEASKAATARTGVVYLSRIPPFMKPQKMRDLLARFGTVGRVFLAPEDPKSHARRVKFGGNKKRDFVEGWIEYMNKKDAKLAAETLNTHTIGGKKGSYYYDDVWNIKYLPKFKWHHLQAQIGAFLPAAACGES